MTHLSPKLLIPRDPAVDDITRPGLKLFVYGTLMPGQSAWEQFCAGQVTAAMPARVQARMYHLPRRGFPAIAESDDPSSLVDGFLLYFADESFLSTLDEYEDYYPDQPAANCFYYRKHIACLDPTGVPFDSAWTYFMSADKIIAERGILCGRGLWKPVKFFDNRDKPPLP